jgi:alpha-L-rhamnosidase
MTSLDRRRFLQLAAAGGGFAAIGAPTTARAATTAVASGPLRIDRTATEYAEQLLGTDVTRPRLSWISDAGGTGAKQSAYRILVAHDPADLVPGRADVWDSGKIASPQSVGIDYDGPAVEPRTRYFWRAQVWDEADRESTWSPARWWETGLLGEEWTADWIGAAPPSEDTPGFAGTFWIWTPGATTSNAPAGTRWFRGRLSLPAGEVTRARIVMTADDDFVLHLDGQEVLRAPQMTDGWRTARLADVTDQVRAAGSALVLAAAATNRPGPSINPAGLLGRLIVEYADGATVELITDGSWRSTGTEQSGWTEEGFDDSSWDPVTVLAPYGQGPWGSNVQVATPTAPAPLLRREFDLPGPVSRARLYVAGLAYQVVHVNGRRVGSSVLDPGFTAYDDTVLYRTYDVTHDLRPGSNAVGVELGRGFFGMTTPNVWNWHRPPWHTEPQLIARLEVEHPDGSRTVVTSDASWRITDGPTRDDSLYAGETYDARREPRGWTRPRFDDADWRPVTVREAPPGSLVAQQHEPIEVIETVTPSSITELRPGRCVVDMGRTMAGWAKLTVEEPAGTVISLTYGEKVRADGTVIAENGLVSGSRFQRDEYTSAGRGDETWEPQFSYKGFRYVQIDGVSTRPTTEQVAGRVVHSDLEVAGTFRCSEPFYEKLDQAMRRTMLNNLHGIPTDTPVFEKNGWTGDAHVGLPTMAFAFHMERFLTKWAGDLADSQIGSGQIPVIVPSGGWGYQELAPSPEWTTVYPFLVREMYRWYGDLRLVEEHWDSVTRYVDWEVDRRQPSGLAITALGDWVPPGHQGIPPEDTRLTATAYLYRALQSTATMGDLLGHTEAADHYRAVAAESRDALNAAFLDRTAGHYRTARDPGYRQTSNAIPLAFGMVPDDAVESVVASLVADIRERGDHLNTGCLGTSVLLPVLCAHGHADVAHAIATQTTYPSWGYWFANGADTMWEMWELNSRSRDHYFLGTAAQWLYENVAGLRPGDDGYARFVVRPDARHGLEWARAELETVRGPAGVSWHSNDAGLRLDVDVPVGSEAEIHVPTGPDGDVTAPEGARAIHTEPGFAVYAVGHGSWRFTSRTGG